MRCKPGEPGPIMTALYVVAFIAALVAWWPAAVGAVLFFWLCD